LPSDVSEAAKLWRMAAERGQPGAMYNFGIACYKGEGVDKDEIEAYMWVDLASQQGITKALDTLKLFEKTMQSAQVEEAKRKSDIWQAAHLTANP